MVVVPLCADADCVSTNKSPNAIPISPLLLIFFMIHVSFSSPSEEWQRRAFEAGLLTHGLLLTYSPRLPILLDSGFFVADFVAVHSCEGSGGFVPLFPLPSSDSCFSKTGRQKAHFPLSIFSFPTTPDFHTMG